MWYFTQLPCFLFLLICAVIDDNYILKRLSVIVTQISVFYSCFIRILCLSLVFPVFTIVMVARLLEMKSQQKPNANEFLHSGSALSVPPFVITGQLLWQFHVFSVKLAFWQKCGCVSFELYLLWCCVERQKW